MSTCTLVFTPLFAILYPSFQYMVEIWQEYLFRPSFNLLIWIYNEWTQQNMGWAVVYMTVLIRLCLLPFSVLEVRNQVKNEELYDEIKVIQSGYNKDPVLMKDEIRRVLQKRKVQPWVKAIILGIQGIMFFLLYQVFVVGATGERLLRNLYPSVKIPGSINPMFLGFDITAPYDYFWSGIVTIWLALEIYLGLRRRKTGVKQGDMAYFVLFPMFVFFFLWFLPMVKALFFLTSMVFSAIVYNLLRVIFRSNKGKKEGDKADASA